MSPAATVADMRKSAIRTTTLRLLRDADSLMPGEGLVQVCITSGAIKNPVRSEELAIVTVQTVQHSDSYP
jgi:hypothetical protein